MDLRPRPRGPIRLLSAPGTQRASQTPAPEGQLDLCPSTRHPESQTDSCPQKTHNACQTYACSRYPDGQIHPFPCIRSLTRVTKSYLLALGTTQILHQTPGGANQTSTTDTQRANQTPIPPPEGQSDPLPLNPRLNRRQGQSGTCVYQTPRWSIELLPVHQTPWGGQSDLCPCDECNRHPEGQTNQTICLRHLRGQTPSSATRRTVMGSSGLPNSAAGIRRTNHAPACVSHAGSANQFGSFLTKMSRIVINKRNATFSRIVTYLSRKIDVIFRV